MSGVYTVLWDNEETAPLMVLELHMFAANDVLLVDSTEIMKVMTWVSPILGCTTTDFFTYVYSIQVYIWLAVSTPLKNVSQLGLLYRV